LIRHADTERKRETILHAKLRILRRMHKEGLISIEEASEEYVALDTILRILKDPATPIPMRLLAAKELQPYEALTLSEQGKLALGERGDLTVRVVVAPWAAGPQPKAALPAPNSKEPIIDVDSDTITFPAD
jgi:hypothetical protein